MPRLFTGLEIPSDVSQSLSMLRGGLPGARWIDPENYHVTLRFIGDVDDVVAHEIASMLGRVRREAFELRIEDLKSFGGRKPRQIVATLGPAQALMELHAEHERLMQRVGLEPEGRKYTPHVSLARLRESSSRLRTISRCVPRSARRRSRYRASCCSRRGRRSAGGHT
jgi:2'-5' RNA ligase